MTQNSSNPTYMSKELIDATAQCYPGELLPVYSLSKEEKLKLKTLFMWLEEEKTSWEKASPEVKEEFQKMLNSDDLFSRVGYMMYYCPASEFMEDYIYFYEIEDDRLVFDKRRKTDEEKNRKK